MLTAGQRKAINLLRAMKAQNQDQNLNLVAYAKEAGESYYHLEQICIMLRRHNLVRSFRGPGGGYRVNPTYKFITLLDVMNAVTSRKETEICEIQTTINDALSRVIVA